MDFRVDLDVFRGPLDLLLYLVRKHEVEIVDIPIATITDQYLEYLAVLEQLDVDAVGDFLAMASTLIEIKSQQVLPRADEVEDAIDDPREELVRRLLEYKKYRDAASILEERSRQWQQQYPRLGGRSCRHGSAIWPRSRSTKSSCGTWSARSAASCATAELSQPSNIVYDDTPIHVYMTRIQARLQEAGPAGLQRPVRAGHAQVDDGGDLSGRAGTGAAPPAWRSSRTPCSAKSGWWPKPTTAIPWTCRRSTITSILRVRGRARAAESA